MSELIKKNKVYIIFFIILLIYLGITMIFVQKEKNIKDTLLVTYNSQFKYNKKNGFVNIPKQNFINWEKYKIYLSNKYVGDYYLQYYAKWNIYTDDKDPYKYDENIHATTDDNISILDYHYENITDDEINRIDKFLKKNQINISQYKYMNGKIIIDDENNSTIDAIYNIIEERYDDNIHSLILIEKNNKLILLTESDLSKNQYIYSLNGIIKLKNNNSPKLIITRDIFGRPDSSCELIYELKNNKPVILAGCEN